MLPKPVPSATRRLFFSLPHPLIYYFFPLPVAAGKTALPGRGNLPQERDPVEEEQGAAAASKAASFSPSQYGMLLIEKGGLNRPREPLRAYF